MRGHMTAFGDDQVLAYLDIALQWHGSNILSSLHFGEGHIDICLPYPSYVIVISSISTDVLFDDVLSDLDFKLTDLILKACRAFAN